MKMKAFSANLNYPQPGVSPRCRAKYFQATDVEALANGGDTGTVLGDSGVDEGIPGSDFQNVACA